MKAEREPPPDGVVVVDKDAGWTSHDVVAKLRGILGTRKVGHAGTLDPDATGVLVVGVGKMTRLLRFLGDTTKAYTGEVVLGTETSTLDASGEVTARHDMGGITPERVAAAAATLTGPIMQVPPMVSAVQVGGKRLHELARQGIEVEREARPVTVHRFTTRPTADPLVYAIDVECSSGTYVRSLAADLGHALGGGGHLRNLRRTAVGAFTLAHARRLPDIDRSRILPMAEGLAHLHQVRVGEDVAAAVAHGKVLDAATLGATGEGPWAVLDAAGALVAVYEAYRTGSVKPAVVVR